MLKGAAGERLRCRELRPFSEDGSTRTPLARGVGNRVSGRRCRPPPGCPTSTQGNTRTSGARATSGGIDVTVTCAGTSGQSCSGGVTLKTTETVQGTKVLAVSSAKHKGKPKRDRVAVVVGIAIYKLNAGQRITLHVKLNAKGRALLHRFRRLPVRVAITQRTTKGTITVSSAKFTLKPTTSKHRKH